MSGAQQQKQGCEVDGVKKKFSCLPPVCPPEGTLEPETSEPEELELIATNGEEFPWDDIRLPQFIKPIRYDIELTPNLTTKWVKGKQIG